MSNGPQQFKKRSAISFIRNFIGVGLMGLVVGLAGLVLGLSVVKGIDGLAGGLMGLIVGYPVGTIIGIIWTNKVGHYYGSLLFGALGSIVGALLAVSLEEPLNLNLDPIMLFGAFFISVPLLCVIGFYLKSKPKETA